MHPIISIADYSFSTYHVLLFLAILAFALCLKFLISRSPLKDFDFTYYLSLIFVSGFIGSKLFYVFEEAELSEFSSKLTDLRHGFVLYGGLVFVLLSSVLYAKVKQLDKRLILDFNIIAFCLSISIGKMACLAAGCCYGRPTDQESIGLVYTHALCAASPKHVPLFPTQILDSLLALLLFGLFIILKLKVRIRNGGIFLLFCLLYPIGRFLSEFYRGDASRGFVFGGRLSLSQFYSLIVFLLTLFFLVIHLKNHEKKDKLVLLKNRNPFQKP